MKGLILAGGKGTRLRPLTVFTPKPIVPVVNRPFLLYQIEILRRAGISDVTLSLSYQPDKIEHQLGRGSEFGVNLWGVYLIWLLVIAIMYLPCRWFSRYKKTHHQWWLSYL